MLIGGEASPAGDDISRLIGNGAGRRTTHHGLLEAGRAPNVGSRLTGSPANADDGWGLSGDPRL